MSLLLFFKSSADDCSDDFSFGSSFAVSKHFTYQPQGLEQKAEAVKLEFVDQISIFFDKKNSVFCFFVGLKFISYSSLFKWSFVPFHVMNFEIAKNNNGISSTMNFIGEI